jgi:hypothetical protein
MNTHPGVLISALVIALPCAIQPQLAVAAQQPQYTAVDLGRTDRPGAGVEWRGLVPNQCDAKRESKGGDFR